MIQAITATAPACYGMCCPKRAKCQRYDAVALTTFDHTQSTCQDGAEFPMFSAKPAPVSPCVGHAYQQDYDEQLTGDASDGCGDPVGGDEE